jgi:hypothetical protein
MGNDKGFLYRNLEAIQDNIYGVIIAGLILGGVGTWSHKMYSTNKNAQIESAKIAAGYDLHHTDINGNGIKDSFYLIDGKFAVVNLDGKPVVNNLVIDDFVTK